MVDDDEAPLIYGVEFQVQKIKDIKYLVKIIQARALCAVSGVPDDDTIRFLVGTQSIKFENQVKKKFFFFFVNLVFNSRFIFLNSMKNQVH